MEFILNTKKYNYTSETSDCFTKGKVYKNIHDEPQIFTLFTDDQGQPHYISDEYLAKKFKPVKNKPNKNKRFAKLEKIIKEQGERLAYLESKIENKPNSTKAQFFISKTKEPNHPNINIKELPEPKLKKITSVDDFPKGLEFKSELYQKVDREPQSGDVIIPTLASPFVTPYKQYKVYQHETEGTLIITSDHGFSIPVFNDPIRILDNMVVYELYKQDLIVSKNEQRKNIIREAENFVTNILEEKNNSPELSEFRLEFTYSVEKRKAEAKLRHKKTGVRYRQSSYIFPSNHTANQSLGKAIVFAMLFLKIESVEKFSDVVQPDKVVVGHTIERLSSMSKLYTRTIKSIDEKIWYEPKQEKPRHLGWDSLSILEQPLKILEDTKAKY